VQAKEFQATNLTFNNDYDETIAASQALALGIYGDRAVLKNVRVLADQDTFRTANSARVYVVNSYIEGTVDFIYGDGSVVFNACKIYEKRTTGGPITAANTAATNKYGFLFYKSTITGKTNNTTQLGRPWRQDAQVTFRESSLSATIATAQPWINMGTATWQNARFYEYKNTGAGATVNSNRKQLTDAQAASYTPQKYLAGTDGWNPI
jgi:pectinesterase